MSEEYVPGYETAVLPILEWVSSNEWSDAYQAHGDEFYGELEKAFEAPVHDVLAQLPTPLMARAARCCFDDFLTVEYESTPRNVLDQYLDEVGMDLEPADVDFLIAFRNSVVRVYEVVGRTPYESLVLRDLLGGTSPIRIDDEMATAALSAGDKIATRVLTINEKDYLAGSILVLDYQTHETFKDVFESAFQSEVRSFGKHLQKNLWQRNLVRQRVLKDAAAALSGMWIATVFAALEDMAPLATEDDPETLFEATIPYTLHLEPIVECLEAHPDLDRPIPKEFLWLWHADRTDPEASLKAMVWIWGLDIYMESCDRGRIEDAVATLKGLLGDSVGEAEIRELDYDVDGWADLEKGPSTEEEDAALRERLHLYLDHHFRSALDNPVPELNERVPRELAKTAKGRTPQSRWLSAMEAQFQANPDQIGLVDYDLTWVWEELGIESLRQSGLFG